MLKHITAGALALLAAGCIAAPDMAAVEAAAAQFYEQQANGDDLGIYQAAAGPFRNSATVNELHGLNSAVRALSCETPVRNTGQWHNNISDDGHFITVTYDRQCETGTLTETFIFSMESERAFLMNYNAAGTALQQAPGAPVNVAPGNTPPKPSATDRTPTTPT